MAAGLAGGAVVLALAGWLVLGGEAPSGDPSPRAGERTREAEPLPAAEPVLTGRVVDRVDGGPVPTAWVTLRCPGEAPVEVVADPDGRFAADPPKGRGCTVAARAEGWLVGPPGTDGAVEVSPDRLDVSLPLVKAATGRVRVLGPDGQPVPRATVTLLHLSAPGVEAAFSETLAEPTSAAGMVELGRVLPGELQVLAEDDTLGLAESRPLEVAPGGSLGEVVVRFASGGTVAGWVVDRSDAPVEGASVRLYAAGDASGRVAVSDAEGAFSYPDVPPGPARVVVTGDGFQPPDPVRLEVIQGELHEIDLVVDRVRGFEGVVVGPGGQPVVGASIYLAPPDGPLFDRGGAVTRSRSDGSFAVTAVEAYPVRVFAVHASEGRSEPFRVEGDGERVVLHIASVGSLLGRVVDGAGSPVTEYRITAAGAGGEGRRGQVATRTVRAPDGRFVLSSLQPDVYRVVVEATGLAPAESGGHMVAPGDATDVGTLRLVAGGSVRGRVVDGATSEPLADAMISVLGGPADHHGRGRTASRTGPDGVFEVTGLPDLRVSLQIVRRGYATRLVSGVDLQSGRRLDLGDVTLDASERPRSMQYVGVGATLQRTDEGLVFRDVFEGSAAAEAGLAAGTLILRVDGQPTTDLGVARAVELIRGEEGTEVELEVRRPGAFTSEIVRVPRRMVTSP